MARRRKKRRKSSKRSRAAKRRLRHHKRGCRCPICKHKRRGRKRRGGKRRSSNRRTTRRRRHWSTMFNLFARQRTGRRKKSNLTAYQQEYLARKRREFDLQRTFAGPG